MNRRDWLTGAAALGGGLLTGTALAAPRSSPPFFARHKLPLGVQLYTLEPDLYADLDGTLSRLAAMGIRTVETAGFLGRTPAQLRASLDRAGLRCTSAHIPIAPFKRGDLGLGGDMDALARDLHVLGAKYVVMPIPQLATLPTSAKAFVASLMALGRDDWLRTAELLNTKGKMLRARGLSMSYHNHNVEFAPHDWGTAFDLLMNETDPSCVSFEMDAGWVAAAGIDPVALLHAHPHRFTQMHVKDIKASTTDNFALEQDPAEVGSGKMNWPAILPAAYKAGIRGLYIEQEPPYSTSRMASIAKSVAYLQSMRPA